MSRQKVVLTAKGVKARLAYVQQKLANVQGPHGLNALEWQNLQRYIGQCLRFCQESVKATGGASFEEPDFEDDGDMPEIAPHANGAASSRVSA
jgi:hypothetical protein